MSVWNTFVSDNKVRIIHVIHNPMSNLINFIIYSCVQRFKWFNIKFMNRIEWALWGNEIVFKLNAVNNDALRYNITSLYDLYF